MMDQAEQLRRLAMDLPTTNKTDAKVITVTSGKGGVGKSNFVVNLGITLQRMGKKVIIFDADIGMANDDVLMGFFPKYSIIDCVNKNLPVEEVILKGPFGIHLLPGGSGINKLKEFTLEERTTLINKLSGLDQYDYILMDTGAGINETVVNLISFCDEVILLTTPEPTSIMDGYSLLKAVSHYGVKKSITFVINRVEDSNEAMRAYTKLQKAVKQFLGLETNLLGYVSEDKKLPEAVKKQVPFVISSPKCKAAIDVKRIAQSIISGQNTDSGLGMQGLFKKMFKIFK